VRREEGRREKRVIGRVVTLEGHLLDLGWGGEREGEKKRVGGWPTAQD